MKTTLSCSTVYTYVALLFVLPTATCAHADQTKPTTTPNTTTTTLQDDAPTAVLDTGAVGGKLSDDKLVAVFRGVPFAEPPILSLRWAPPKPKAAWTGTRPAVVDAPGCPQACKLPIHTCPPVVSEDCLYANVFTPAKAVGSSTPSLPVLVFIHGGNFIQGYGGGLLYDGEKFARDYGVVFISIQYRLGALGFLYSGDGAGQFGGNFGLLDQQLALKWAQANVGAFGGAADQVTLFGQSAGGASVASHLVMPTSAGLFARAVVMSASDAIPFRTTTNSPKFTRVVSKRAGCGAKGYESCMRNLSWVQVVDAQMQAEKDLVVELGHFLSLFQPYAPTAGTELLPTQPLLAMQRGEAHDVPIIFGSVQQEGLVFLYNAYNNSRMTWYDMDGMLGLVYGIEHVREIKRAYPPTEVEKLVDDMRNDTAPIATDSLFHCFARHTALGLDAQRKSGTRKSSTYVYHYDHVVSFGRRFWLPLDPICVDAVCHGAELPVLFQPVLTPIGANFTADELALSATMQTYWSNLAHGGAPGTAGHGDGAPLEWPSFSSEHEPAMLFRAAGGNEVVQAAFREKCMLWDSIGYSWIHM